MNCIVRHDSKIASQLGGKARALAELGHASPQLPIPDWFVVPPSAFDQSLTDRQQQQLAVGDTTVLSTLRLSESLKAELTEALAQLCPNGERVAVRSSAVDEDGATHSFAGQLDSFLNVAPAAVADRVVEVWRSSFSAHVIAYRQEHHLSPLPAPPAVLIQKMVDAEVAGVAFSAHPVTRERHIAVVSAVYGLGTALVSGEADADLYHVDLQGQILKRQISEKRVAHRLVQEAVLPVAVAADRVDQPALSDTQVQSIAALACQVEQHFGCPQDIEWAIADGQIYLLQARPITTLNSIADSDGELNLWDNSNIAESYGGITTPLTFSFARSAYEAVYQQFCRMMGVSAATIAAHDTTFRRMLGLMRGRIYYNLLNWYRVLALLPGFTVNRRFMEQMMGVREALPANVLALKSPNWRDQIKDSLRFARSIAGLVQNYLTLPRQIQRFYQRLDCALSLPPSELATLRLDQLAAHYHDLERQLLTRWDAPLVNDFFAMIFFGVLRKLTAAWCGDTAGTLQNDLISGEGGMISAEPAQRVKQMATIAARYPELIEHLCGSELPQILQQIETVPALHTQYLAYLAKFGDRCLEELKLESATLHDNPLPLLRSIGQLARKQAAPALPTALPSALSPRQQAESRVAQSLKRQPLRQWIFNWVLHNARQRVRDRENLRFERTRVFGQVRRIFSELGKRFQAIDRLNASSDIFYLEVNEILGWIDGTATCTDFKGIVAVRRAEFDRYRQLPAPADRFQTRGAVHWGEFPSNRVETADGDMLQGTGCCPGIVRAPVQVIVDPKTAELRQGSILVAERTDPGWILLFPAASGLLVERGSLLSHSAIVAREMHLPAIVSLPGATRWLRDGDWVEMDGSTGTVRRIPSPNSCEVNVDG
jgi:pyruvate,water dikinase